MENNSKLDFYLTELYLENVHENVVLTEGILDLPIMNKISNFVNQQKSNMKKQLEKAKSHPKFFSVKKEVEKAVKDIDNDKNPRQVQENMEKNLLKQLGEAFPAELITTVICACLVIISKLVIAKYNQPLVKTFETPPLQGPGISVDIELPHPVAEFFSIVSFVSITGMIVCLAEIPPVLFRKITTGTDKSLKKLKEILNKKVKKQTEKKERYYQDFMKIISGLIFVVVSLGVIGIFSPHFATFLASIAAIPVMIYSILAAFTFLALMFVTVIKVFKQMTVELKDKDLESDEDEFENPYFAKQENLKFIEMAL